MSRSLSYSCRTMWCCLFVCGLLLSCAVPASAGTLPVDPVSDPSIWSLSDTWRVAMITSVASSPSGREIAYVVRRPVTDATTSLFRSTIYTVQADGSGTRQLTGDAYSSMSPAWSPDGSQIAYISEESGTPQVWVAGTGGGWAYRLTNTETGVTAFSWSPDGKQISYTAMVPPTAAQKQAVVAKEDPIVAGQDPGQIGLYSVRVGPTALGYPEVRQITPPDMTVLYWDWLPDGSGIIVVHAPAADDKFSVSTAISRIDLRNGTMTLLVPQPANHAYYSPVLVSPDGKSVAYMTQKTFNLADISVVPVNGGQSRVIASDLDLGGVLMLGITGWSADGKTLYVPGTKGTLVTMNAFPVDGSAPSELFRHGFIRTIQESGWRTVFVYTAEDTATPPEVYVTPIDKYVPFQVTRLNADLPLGKIGRTEVVRWNSTDGMVIEGLLTYPANYTRGTRYPLVIEPHGGPSGNYAGIFTGGTGWPVLPAGTFSSLGYAVLRPNIRGSTGYGVDFTKANYGDWGGGDYRDLIAGADYLVAQGIADPGRLGIIGQSYGGYMAAWSVTQTPRFRGAVVIDGITDLISNAGTSDIPYDEPDNLGGEYWQKWDLYSDRSPVRHVANVTTPTLVVSGQNDIRVPLGQSQEYYTALHKLGIPSRFVIYPRAGHFPNEPKQVTDLWQREIDWMNRYVKGAS